MKRLPFLRTITQLESLESLDRLIEPVHGYVSKIMRRIPQRDLFAGTALGHPAHPLLVNIPIGCWTSALVADLAREHKAAQTLTAAGVLAVLPTAATGISDWVDTTGAERRIGFVHLVVNVSATAIYVASWSARRRGHNFRGPLLGLAGATVASVGGWLGGHLAYAMGVGVDTTAFSGGPTEWTEIASPGDAPLHAVKANGIALVVFENEQGDPLVLADRCSHRGGPLSEGEVTENCVTCPWHGSQFDIESGEVLHGPATMPQPVYEVKVSAEGTEVRRSEPRSLRTNPV